MRHFLTVLLMAFIALPAALAQPTEAAKQAAGKAVTTEAPVAAAMTTIFSPARAPQQKTMGLLQRSFLDLADQGDQELELAIVVDGTDSMAAELAGVRESIAQMLDDLRRYRNNEVRVALVVYRDSGSPSGDVVIPLGKFTSDKETISKAVESLQPETGAPYFHELPDLGLHRALTELPWSADNQVTKWILMFGDAPPYAESYQDAKTPQAYRRFATPILVAIAKQKNIRINCVLCTSGDNVAEPYRQAVEETRAFMSAIAGGTDGLMLDLSYDDIRTAMIDAGRRPEVGLAKLQPISEIDLAAVRRDRAGSEASAKTVKLAVIPHMPLNQISFDPEQPAVQFATAIRSTLAKVPGVQVASPRDIKEQLRRLRAQGMEDRQAMRGLAAMLGVDYVVWGSMAPDRATVQTAAYRSNDGQQIIPVRLSRNSPDAAYALIQASSSKAPDDQAITQLLANMNHLQAALTAPLAQSPATHDELMTAIESLDQALAYEAGDDESNALLAKADTASRNALTAEPRNALAHWLQSNVAYNLALREFRKGNPAEAEKHLAAMKKSLAEAVENRETIPVPSLVTEIEADYYLMVRREPEKAAERYLQMTKTDQPLQSQLRGHWMLAGIYGGDWGMAQNPIVDAEKSRFHLVEILANWPESPEAKLLKEWLRWDETKRETEFNYLPAIHVIVRRAFFAVGSRNTATPSAIASIPLIAAQPDENAFRISMSVRAPVASMASPAGTVIAASPPVR